MGICLGHQILGLAAGAHTSRLPFGHHGANHPVREVRTGRVTVTSQNHNFQVDAATLPSRERLLRQPRQPLGRQRGGAGARDAARLLGAIPSRGGAGTRGQPVPVRPFRPDDRARAWQGAGQAPARRTGGAISDDRRQASRSLCLAIRRALPLTRATEADAATLVALYDEAGQWLLARGLRQWPPGWYTDDDGACRVTALGHEVYFVWRDVALAGKIIARNRSDAGDRGGRGRRTRAMCMGSASSRAFAGRGAGRRAARLGRSAGAAIWSPLRCGSTAWRPTLRCAPTTSGSASSIVARPKHGWATLYEHPA